MLNSIWEIIRNYTEAIIWVIFGREWTFAYDIRVAIWGLSKHLWIHNEILIFIFFTFFIPLIWLWISLWVGSRRYYGISLINQFALGAMYMCKVMVFLLGLRYFFIFKDLNDLYQGLPLLGFFVWTWIISWMIRGTYDDYAYSHQTYLICLRDHEDMEGEGALWDLGYLSACFLCFCIYITTVMILCKKWYLILAIAAVCESVFDGLVLNWFVSNNPPPIPKMPPRWICTYVWNRFIVEDDVTFAEDDFSHELDDERQDETIDILMHVD